MEPPTDIGARLPLQRGALAAGSALDPVTPRLSPRRPGLDVYHSFLSNLVGVADVNLARLPGFEPEFLF